MSLEIVQRSEAPNDAWRNLELHYSARGTGLMLRILHEVNVKTMEPWEDPFKSIMEIDRLAADLDRSGTELRKCVVIVVGLFADYDIECWILENNPTSLERAEIKLVKNPYNRLLRQQQESKALLASNRINTVDRGKIRRPIAVPIRLISG